MSLRPLPFPIDVFALRHHLVADYERFARSFTTIAADDISAQVDEAYEGGRYWPDPLIQVNPRVEPSKTVDELAAQGVVHPQLARIFRVDDPTGTGSAGTSLPLHCHRHEALSLGHAGNSLVPTDS